MDTTAIGRLAEQRAAEYLDRQGYTILARNWRQPDCEIDIIAGKQRVIYFVEVKYRASGAAGGGLDYIGPAKLRRMAYAARRWVAAQGWKGEYVLAAVEVSGEEYEVTAFVDCIV